MPLNRTTPPGTNNLASGFGKWGLSGSNSANFSVSGLSAAQSAVAGQVMSILMAGGLSAAGAAGMVGNWAQESSLNPSASGGYLGQWLGSRLAALQSYASSTGQPVTSVRAQAGFALSELKSGYSSLYAYLQTVKDPAAAALAISNQYERPAAATANNGYRAQTASAVYAAAGGKNPGMNAGSVSGTTGTSGSSGGGFTNIVGDAVSVAQAGGGGIIGNIVADAFNIIAPVAGAALSLVIKDIAVGIGDYVIIPLWHWNQRAVDYYWTQILDPKSNPSAFLWTVIFWSSGYVLLFVDPTEKTLKPAQPSRTHFARHVKRGQLLPARRELVKPKDTKSRTPKKPKPIIARAAVHHTNTLSTHRNRPVRVDYASRTRDDTTASETRREDTHYAVPGSESHTSDRTGNRSPETSGSPIARDSKERGTNGGQARRRNAAKRHTERRRRVG